MELQGTPLLEELLGRDVCALTLVAITVALHVASKKSFQVATGDSAKSHGLHPTLLGCPGSAPCSLKQEAAWVLGT
jgi:hypothetical protein